MFATRSMHDSVTGRSPSYAILAIDSEDRFKDYETAREVSAGPISSRAFNYSPYDFQITKNESMMNGFFTRLALTEVNFPWVIPNINAKTADIHVTYRIGAAPAVTQTITLPAAFYRPSEIAAGIQALVTGLAGNPVPGFTMAYGDQELPRFSYNTHDANIKIAFEPLDYNTTLYPYPATTKQLFDILGFNDDNTVLGANNIYETGGSTFCQAIRYIDIVCSQLTYNQALKDTMSQTVARDTLCRLYIADGVGSSQYYLLPSDPNFAPIGTTPFPIYRQFQNPKFIRWTPNQPVQGNLRFEVFDDDGNSLEDSIKDLYISAENWSMTLLVSED